MRLLAALAILVVLTGCTNYGAYTGSSTYGGGDSYGVTVYKTIYSSQAQVDTEAVLHCKKFNKIARRLSCSSVLVNSCSYVCDEPPPVPNKAAEKAKTKDDENRSPAEKATPRVISGSGFFISSQGHVVTNAHVVEDCKTVSVGDTSKNQAFAEIISSDEKNDLALLKLSSLDKASVASMALIQKLGVKVVPLAANGLLRSDDVRLGENVLVAGYPYGEVLSDTVKVTSGTVSSTRGAGDNSAQFQLDAAVQSGNSGGPIYDAAGSIVGVVVSQLDKLKIAKAIGTLPENVMRWSYFFGQLGSQVKVYSVH